MKRALIITEDADHARRVSELLEKAELAGEILVQADPTNDIGTHESLHRLASLGTLAAGAAHEVNNLLTYVSVALDRLSAPAHLATGSDLDTMVATAVDCCTRMQGILRGITGYARQGGAGRVPLELPRVVDQALELVRGDLATTADLEVVHAPDLPYVMGNTGQLMQVLVNLLINAIHAVAGGPGHGQITIRTSRREERLAVEIEDNGHGIPTDKLDRVFEAFYTTKGEDVGTGLGLYLARSIARKHGGDISIQSRIGQGTTVVLELPIAE